MLQCVAVRVAVHVAVCGSVMQRVAVFLRIKSMRTGLILVSVVCVAVRVAVCRSVLQCVLQCVAA